MALSMNRDEFGMTVKFGPPSVQCKGRNGFFSLVGYNVDEDDRANTYEVRGITARNGLCYSACISVPKQAWVGAALDALLDDLKERKQLPGCLGLHPLLDMMVAERLQKK